MVNLQSLIISYSHDFWLMMLFTLCAAPVAFVLGPTKATFREKTMRPDEVEEITE